MSYELPYTFTDPPVNNDGAYSTATVGNELLCDGEEYLTTPLATGSYTAYRSNHSGTPDEYTLDHIALNKTSGNHNRCAIYYFSTGSNMGFSFASNSGTFWRTGASYGVSNFTYGGYGGGNQESILNTNVPIFSTLSEAQQYLGFTSDEDAKQYIKDHAINAEQIINTNETQDYYIFNTYDTCNINLGIVTYTGGDPTGRFEIFKANSEPVLYFVDEEHSCELGIIATDIVGSVYSSINKQDVLNKQFDASSWTVGSLIYTGPFYHPLQYLPDGSYTIGVTWDTNIYIAHSRQQAEDYIAGLVPPEDLYNYSTVGKPNVSTNETGTQELITTFGNNYSENVFSHDYLMSRTELADVGGKFFDTNILTALLDGLKLYGNNPMDSVLSCLYFGFDLSTICTSTSVTDIYFGSYKMENVSAKKVSSRSGYKELGTTYIKPTFYNWLDYEAMHIYLYLPYVGFVELEVSKYLKKWLKIIYMIDLHSGECEVSLCADDLLMDTYSGQIGIKQPITYQDLATYFQSQITALRNGVMSSVGLPIAGTATGAGIGAQTGNPYGAAAGAIAGAAVTAPFVAPNAIYQGVKVANYKPPLFSKGGYSSEIGANMPQYAFLVFMYNDIQEPDNLVEIFGKPSNESGPVGSFSGFLSVSSVNLQCSNATDAEKAEIVSLLHNGIYI